MNALFSVLSRNSTPAVGRAPADTVRLLGMLALFGFLMLGNLGGWDLWNPDEPRYAQVAREMLETRQYILPHLNAEAYPDKPPLFFWLVALFSKPFGDVSALTARLPSALAALGVLWLTFLLGRKLFNPLTGFVAAAVLFTSGQFFYLALRANIDMTLTLLTTLALFLFLSGYLRREQATGFYLGAYAVMGFAVLTKGPVGLCVPLLGVAAFLVARGEFSLLKKLQFGKGLLITGGIVAIWLVPACLLGGSDYAHQILGKQIFGRVVHSYSHRHPFYYYLMDFPLNFLPWSMFVPSACVYFWQQRKTAAGMAFPLAWFISTFIFFSMISGKRSLYLLPLYPAGALLVAKLWSDHILIEARGAAVAGLKLFRLPGLLFFALVVTIGVVAGSLLVLRPGFAEPLTAIRTAVYPAAILCAAGGVLGIMLIKQHKPVTSLLTIMVLVMISLWAVAAFKIFPAFNAFKSAQPFCRRIQAAVGPDDRLVACFEPELFNYFLHRYPIPAVTDEEQLFRIIASPEKVYLLATKKQIKRAPEPYRQRITVLDRAAIGHRTYCLVTNSPGDQTALTSPAFD